MASPEKEMRFELGLEGCTAFEYICRGRKRIFTKKGNIINKDTEKEIMISDMLIWQC